MIKYTEITIPLNAVGFDDYYCTDSEIFFREKNLYTRDSRDREFYCIPEDRVNMSDGSYYYVYVYTKLRPFIERDFDGNKTDELYRLSHYDTQSNTVFTRFGNFSEVTNG
jgi:hypothetical protein